MVIVGLTALAPEWLELKDDKIAQLKESVSQAQSNSNFSPPLINLNYEQLTVKINQFIGLIDKPENIGVPGAILLVFLWDCYLIIMYAGFILVWLVIYWGMSSLMKKHILINHISQNSPKLFVLFRIVFSLLLTVLFWSILNLL